MGSRVWLATCCFNGATAMKPWKRVYNQLQAATVASLQWGHGDEAVEETSPITQGIRLRELQWGPA